MMMANSATISRTVKTSARGFRYGPCLVGVLFRFDKIAPLHRALLELGDDLGYGLVG